MQCDETRTLMDSIEAARGDEAATLSPWRPWHDDMKIIRLGMLREHCLALGTMRQLAGAPVAHKGVYARALEAARAEGRQFQATFLRRARR